MYKLGETGSKNVLKNAPGLQQATKIVRTSLKKLSLFISDDMLNDVVEYRTI